MLKEAEAGARRRSWSESTGSRSNLLPLEVQVRRCRSGGRKLEAWKRRTAAEAYRGGSDAGQPGAESGRRKKMVKPSCYRQAVGLLRAEFQMSERRACCGLGIASVRCRYRVSRGGLRASLLEELRHQAAMRPRFGYRRLTVLLRRLAGG